jgi:hypothetical protein
VPVRVYQVPQPLPRAYLVEGVRPLAGPIALATLTDPAFDPRREVILPRGAARTASPVFSGAARVTRRSANALEIETSASAPATLVVVESYDPGWRADVDGRPAPVIPANLHFRGIPLEAGPHRVHLSYRPTTAVVGLLVSLSAWLVALGALLWGLLRARARRAV